ncbi:endo-1,4-beta-mannosidase [Aureobasidium subglaciale]|nr:endo-1,4-beta-mannosidase [Aureobasidium subglaciale]
MPSRKECVYISVVDHFLLLFTIMKYSLSLATLAAAGVAYAQSAVPAYGQCGGQGYTGSAVCVSGFHCSKANDYYSQCVAGAASSVATTIKTSTSEAPVPSPTTVVTKPPISTSKIVSTSKAVTTTAAASGSFPTTSGTKFVIDGKAGYYAGTNSYWIGFLTNNNDVDLVMQHLASSGLKILRVWGFNDVTTTPTDGTVYFQSFANGEATINTGSNGLQRLDYVVKSAEAHGIKLIINFVNNWTDYGGMAAYFSYAGISSNTQWYNNTKAQTQYQKYIKAVVSRYTASPAIFAWELANEPRCTGCDLSTLKTWVVNTSKYIKSLDPKHMVTTGEEGFGPIPGDDGSYPYQLSAGGSNFTANCETPTIDFCTYHLYPESWSVTPTQQWGNQWIVAHAKACSAVGKPCLLEEFGASNDCTIESDWQATALKAVGTGADLFWQYGDTLSGGKTSQDGNTAYYGDDLYKCLVDKHIKAIDSL